MSKFRKPLSERIKDFRNDVQTRRRLQTLLSDEVMVLAMDLLREACIPKGSANPAPDTSSLKLAFSAQFFAGCGGYERALYDLCDAPEVQQEQSAYPDLLSDTDELPVDLKRTARRRKK